MSVKIETKGCLWEVYITSGCYSDRSEQTYVFAGNTFDEVKAFVKIWAKEIYAKGSYNYGFIFEDGEQFLYKEWDKTWQSEPDWGTCYGDASSVQINRLNVIYVNPD